MLKNKTYWGKVGMGLLMIGLSLLVGFNGGIARDAIAAGRSEPIAQSAPNVQHIHLGTAQGDLSFVPDHLSFKAEQTYKLILDNPSPIKHYFTAKDFADGIWTKKVQAGAVEVKGAIHELELKPTGEAEWVFIPEKPGTYELHCSIPGHAEAGMVGELTIEVS